MHFGKTCSKFIEVKPAYDKDIKCFKRESVIEVH